MNILFLTIVNMETIDEHGIYSDLLTEFRIRNFKLFIVHPVERRTRKKTSLQIIDGVNYLRVRTGNITKSNFVEKGFSFLTLERSFRKAINRFFDGVNFDMILYSTPPITFSNLIQFYKKRDRSFTYLLLKDIFPQNAVDLGYFAKRSIFYKYFRCKETRLYQVSDMIGCMTKNNIRYILENNRIDPKKIEECPNSIKPITFEYTKNELIEVRKKYKLPLDKTIYIYGGNIGKPQGVSFILECIKLNEKNEDTFILIVGNGTEYKWLNDQFSKLNFHNSKILNFIPRIEYDKLVHACDVGLIFLDFRFSIPNFPSRILSYMQASKPIIAATDLSTDIHEIIVDNKLGFWCSSDDPKVFNEQLLKFTDEKLRSLYGQNSFDYLLQHYTSVHTFNIINKHIKL